MTFRAYADNVVIQIEPRETQTESGLTLVHGGKNGAREHRTARVVASGPGYYRSKPGGANGTERGVFVPNEVKPGMRVIVDALAGQDYALDLSVPRHNKSAEFQELFGDKGEFRIVREEEILAVIEDSAAAFRANLKAAVDGMSAAADEQDARLASGRWVDPREEGNYPA
jgi:co-chaperonin GroES (HSP10)